MQSLPQPPDGTWYDVTADKVPDDTGKFDCEVPVEQRDQSIATFPARWIPKADGEGPWWRIITNPTAPPGERPNTRQVEALKLRRWQPRGKKSWDRSRRKSA